MPRPEDPGSLPLGYRRPATLHSAPPVDYVHLSSVAMEATGISDFNGYFQKREEWLQLEITDTLDPVEREATSGPACASSTPPRRHPIPPQSPA